MPRTFNADGSPDGDDKDGYDYLSRRANINKAVDADYRERKSGPVNSYDNMTGGMKSIKNAKGSYDKLKNMDEEDSEMYRERAKRATKP